MLEIGSSPEGKGSYRIPDEGNDWYFPNAVVSIFGNVKNLELSNCCKSRKKSNHMGHKWESISNGNDVGSMVDFVVNKNSGSLEQRTYVEFEYCKNTCDPQTTSS